MSTAIASDTPIVTAAGEEAAPELRPLRLRTNFAWTLAGFAVYGVSQFAWMSILSKMESPEKVGRLGLALAITAPVVMFTRLQLRGIQATDARDEYRFSDYLALRLVSTVVGMAMIAVIVFAGSHFWHYSGADIAAVMAFALMRAVEGISEVIYGLLQKYERLDLQARSLIIKGVVSTIVFPAMIWLTHSVAWGGIGITFSYVILMWAYDIRNARRIMKFYGIEKDFGLHVLRAGWSERLPVLRQLTWLALPLGFVAMLDSLNTNLPRLLIQGHVGLAGLGLFSIMAMAGIGGNMVVSSLATSASPRLSRQYIHNVSSFAHLVWKLVQFGAALGGGAVLIAALFAKPLLTLLSRPEYAKNPEVFVWLMAAAGIGYVARFLVYSMTAARYLRAQAPLYGISLAVIGGLTWVLLPGYGLLGAAWASCAGMLILLVGAAAVNLHAIRARSTVVAAEVPTGIELMGLNYTQPEDLG